MIQAISACAVAASVALSAVALNPALRNLVFHHHAAAQSVPVAGAPRVVVPSGRRIRDCFSGARAGRAGSGAAHAR